jgi:hypothetical protein
VERAQLRYPLHFADPHKQTIWRKKSTQQRTESERDSAGKTRESESEVEREGGRVCRETDLVLLLREVVVVQDLVPDFDIRLGIDDDLFLHVRKGGREEGRQVDDIQKGKGVGGGRTSLLMVMILAMQFGVHEWLMSRLAEGRQGFRSED